jgi:hypothetical protein
MKTSLLAALLLLPMNQARAEDFRPIHSDPVPASLTIHVVNYIDILGQPSSTVRCMKADNKFGYIVTREGENYMIDVISNGKLEGEKSRMKATLKDYGSPFVVYLSVYDRFEDYGKYFELLLFKKVNDFAGGLVGDVMFTEAYYSKEDGKEKETFKPIWKERLRCEAGE